MCGILLQFLTLNSQHKFEGLEFFEQYLNNPYLHLHHKEELNSIIDTNHDLYQYFLQHDLFHEPINDQQINETLQHRGPDQQNIVDYVYDRGGHTLMEKQQELHHDFINFKLYHSLLHMRGSPKGKPIPQPLRSGDNLLLFNGEIYAKDSIPLPPHQHDTLYLNELFGEISASGGEQYIPNMRMCLQSLQGDFAIIYVDVVRQKIIIAKDFFGKKSLLLCFSEHGFTFTSQAIGTATIQMQDGGEEDEESGKIDAEYVKKKYMNEFLQAQGKRFMEMPGNMLIIIDFSHPVNVVWSSHQIHEFQIKSVSEALDSPIQRVAHQLTQSTQILIQNIFDLQVDFSPPQQQSIAGHDESCLAILFSGGLDCTVIAYLVGSLLTTHHNVDLLNVSFQEGSPDRVTAIESYLELQGMFKHITFNLILIDKSISDVEQYELEFMQIIYPKVTHMDFNIAMILKFASEGKGVDYATQQPRHSTARVLLSGLGADEIFSGYSRYRVAFLRGGVVEQFQEMKMGSQRHLFNQIKMLKGRDDRSVSSSGKELRFPYLDLQLLRVVWESVPHSMLADYGKQKGQGDKEILRAVAAAWGLRAQDAAHSRSERFNSAPAQLSNPTSDTLGATNEPRERRSISSDLYIYLLNLQSSMYQNDTQQFVDDLKTGQNNILVAIRVRPLNQKEQSLSEFQTIRILDGKVIILLDPVQEFNQDDVLRKNRIKETQFAFDYVFDQWAPQQSIYEQTTDFLMVGLLDGYNATIFSYGSTGSGKTFTMIGSPQEQGIMPRSMQNLFQSLQSDKLSNFKDVQIKVSYLEIYNENIRDLLTMEDKNLDVREDKNAGIVIAGLTEVDVKGVAEVMALLKVGNKNRSKEATEANLNSSRSHAILQVQIDCREKHQGLQDQLIQSKLSLVDLAGSERAANTNNKGIRMVEGAKINQSLLVLGNCIQALSEASEKGTQRQQFIPYRNSKLTRLLKDSLGGNCRTVMISNVSPSVGAFDETYNTLVYANRAKNIKTVVNRNVLNAQNHISSYAEMIKNLRLENEELKNLISNNQQQQQPQPKPVPKSQTTQHNQSQDLENSLNSNYQELHELSRKINDMEDREDNFTQNLQFIQSQQRASKDSLDQLKLHDKMDNCVQQLGIIQKSNKDLQRQFDDVIKKKDNLTRIVESYDETAYRSYLVGLIKQGDLSVENMKSRQFEKRTRLSEKQRTNTNKTSVQTSEYNKLVLPTVSYTKNQTKLNQLIPGVNSPYPKYGTRPQIQQSLQQQFSAQKKPLKLPPVNLLNLNKLINGKKYISNAPPNYNNISNQSIGTGPNRQSYHNVAGNRYGSQQHRSPYGQVVRSSKSAKARGNSNHNISTNNQNLSTNHHTSNNNNKSLDYNNSSDDVRNQYSVLRLKQMHDQYQAQRFQRAFSGKRNHQNSMPQLNNKILMPGMVHESPYVKNFQKDSDTLEIKKERLKRLNINHKAEGKQFLLN